MQEENKTIRRENKTKPLSNSKPANLPAAYTFLKHKRAVMEIKIIFLIKKKFTMLMPHVHIDSLFLS